MAVDESIKYRAENLLLKYKEETGAATLADDGLRLIEWLNTRVTDGNLSSTTAKIYRRWLAAYLEDIGHPSGVVVRNWLPPGSREDVIVRDDLEAGQLIQHVQVMASETNKRYASYIDQDGFKALMRQLMEETASGGQRYKGGEKIVAMLVLTAMTGLRPKEWPTARLLDSYYCPDTRYTLGPVLEVQTLKQEGRREDNPLKAKRHLLLDRWAEPQIQQLRFFLDEVVRSGDFDKWYHASRSTLSRAWNRLSESSAVVDSRSSGGSPTEKQLTVTFYTARHIFAEEVRRSLRYTRFELAAMLGHSMLTNQKYYGPRDGKAQRGFEFTLPRPWPGDADAIEVWDRQVNPLAHRAQQGDLFFEDAPSTGIRDAISEFYAR